MSKKSGTKPKSKAAAVDENAVTRQIVLANYTKLCKCVCLSACLAVTSTVSANDEMTSHTDSHVTLSPRCWCLLLLLLSLS